MIFFPLNCLCKALLEVCVFNRQIRRVLKGNLAKIYLKRYLKKAMKLHYEPQELEANSETIIWQYWEQGLENAPEIVKICVDSVEKYKNGHKHLILSRENIKDYVDIPDYIWELNDKKVIKSAHMSDIIRTYLLAKYGGVWIDATVLLSKDLPNYVTDSELFVFQNELKIDLDGLNMASYFMAAKPHNEIIVRTQHLLNEYWKENCFLNNYFMFLHAFTMVSQANENLRKMYKNIPFFSFIPVQRFSEELLNQYSEARWEQLKSISPFYKLSYKSNVLNKNNKDIKGTFMEKLLNRELV